MYTKIEHCENCKKYYLITTMDTVMVEDGTVKEVYEENKKPEVKSIEQIYQETKIKELQKEIEFLKAEIKEYKNMVHNVSRAIGAIGITFPYSP